MTKQIINRSLQENTNLSDSSDWLTRIIIGAGLVQLKERPSYIMRVGRRIGAGMTTDAKHIESAAIVPVGLLFNTPALGYFVARFIVTGMMQNRE